MKKGKGLLRVALALCMVLALLPAGTMKAAAANAFQNSDFIETEQPELSQETKALISLYQKDPTEENYLNLRAMVIQNYNAVLERKEEKLAELRVETAGKPGGEETVAEMEEIVQEMYITYWNRINSSMLRFTDTRLLKWRIADAPQYEYIPVMGAGESIYIKRTPVTNEEYAAFVRATGTQAPSNWPGGTYPKGEDDLPVNFISYADAEAYCAWLTERDGVNTYRLPNESEWELAAGHMPKDTDFNCGVTDGRTPVDQYEGITRGAHGAIDFWGNVWEWTSTVRSDADGAATLAVKGGSWRSERTECRTEHRKEGRDPTAGYEDVGFRPIQVLGDQEPEQKVELATLGSPVVSASSTAPDSITLSWRSVEGAVEYQLFEYFEDTGLLKMLDSVKGTSATIDGLESGSTHSYIVQPISYVEIADNVSPENAVKATCGHENKVIFSDVADDAWYADSVRYVTDKGLFQGASETSFSPGNTMTRAMMATVLARLDGADTTPAEGESWYVPGMAWAVEAGVSDGTNPNGAITREQLATMLWRYAGKPETAGTLENFVDANQVSDYAVSAMKWAVEMGIVNGKGNGVLDPKGNATRAEVATMLMRFCEHQK